VGTNHTPLDTRVYTKNMVKRVAKSGSTTLLTKDDRAYLLAFKQAARRHVKKVTRTRAAAMQELVDAGIYAPSGKLRKQYRSVA
jgi:hypothetical protein